MTLDPASPEPAYRQIAAQLAAAARAGRLTAGDPLPGTRELAERLGVNRKTVTRAYEDGIARGWLRAVPQRGVFIAGDNGDGDDAAGLGRFAPAFDGVALPPYFDALPSEAGPGWLTIDNGAPDVRLLPHERMHRGYRRALREVFTTASRPAASPSPQGLPALREALAGMLRQTRGMPVRPEEVCVTRGTQMALHAVAATLLVPGDRVVVERWSYPPAWALFRTLGAEVSTVGMDSQGLDVDALAALCDAAPVRMVYVTPHHQFPTGVRLAPERRRQLLALARKHGFVILEEDYDHEFNHRGDRGSLPLASGNPGGHVVHIGSLSKVLAPSFQCAYVAAPTGLTQALCRRLGLVSRHGDAVVERMIAGFIEDGGLRAHVRKAGRVYRARRDAMVQALREAFGEAVAIDPPASGLALWARFAAPLDTTGMVRRAPRFQLRLRDGALFSPSGEPVNALRLGFGSLDDGEMREAVARLARAAGAG